MSLIAVAVKSRQYNYQLQLFIGHITTVCKKGNKSDPSDYRQIMCKLMESLIRDHIVHFPVRIRNLALNSMVLLKAGLFFRMLDRSGNAPWL